jgi:hypothetical protein
LHQIISLIVSLFGVTIAPAIRTFKLATRSYMRAFSARLSDPKSAPFLAR